MQHTWDGALGNGQHFFRNYQTDKQSCASRDVNSNMHATVTVLIKHNKTCTVRYGQSDPCRFHPRRSRHSRSHYRQGLHTLWCLMRLNNVLKIECAMWCSDSFGSLLISQSRDDPFPEETD